VHEGAQDILSAHQAAIKKSEARTGHHQDQGALVSIQALSPADCALFAAASSAFSRALYLSLPEAASRSEFAYFVSQTREACLLLACQGQPLNLYYASKNPNIEFLMVFTRQTQAAGDPETGAIVIHGCVSDAFGYHRGRLD